MTETPGSILQAARRYRDWTLEKVADRMKLPVEKIKAIENDNFTPFQSDVFVVGLLRRYAKILKIESDYIIQIYNRDFKKDLAKERKTRRNISALEETEAPAVNNNKIIEKFFNKKFIIIFASLFILMFFLFNIGRLVTSSLNPPFLKLTNPIEITADNEVRYTTEDNILIIRGMTDKNTVVKINNIPVNIKTGLNFESDPLPMTSEENVVNIEATNNLGIKSNIKLVVQRIFKKVEVDGDN